MQEIKTLTQIEQKDLLPEMEKTLKTVFKGSDKFIEWTNKDKAEAFIWQTVDDKEIRTLAEHLIEFGAKNKIVAEAVRRVTAAQRMLEIGLITGPRFWLTWNHYQEHGGFVFPFPTRKPAQPPQTQQNVRPLEGVAAK